MNTEKIQPTAGAMRAAELIAKHNAQDHEALSGDNADIAKPMVLDRIAQIIDRETKADVAELVKNLENVTGFLAESGMNGVAQAIAQARAVLARHPKND